MKILQKFGVGLVCLSLIFTLGCSNSSKKLTSSPSNSKTATATKQNSTSSSLTTGSPAATAVITSKPTSTGLSTDQISKEALVISKSKTYEASSKWQEPGYESDKAFDDNIDTRWSSTIIEENSWISVDFGGSYTVSAISFNECKEWSNVASYIVQVPSGDGWTDVYTGGEVVNDELVSINKVTTSKMRFVFDNVLGKAATFFDISAFGYK